MARRLRGRSFACWLEGNVWVNKSSHTATTKWASVIKVRLRAGSGQECLIFTCASSLLHAICTRTCLFPTLCCCLTLHQCSLMTSARVPCVLSLFPGSPLMPAGPAPSLTHRSHVAPPSHWPPLFHAASMPQHLVTRTPRRTCSSEATRPGMAPERKRLCRWTLHGFPSTSPCPAQSCPGPLTNLRTFAW